MTMQTPQRAQARQPQMQEAPQQAEPQQGLSPMLLEILAEAAKQTPADVDKMIDNGGDLGPNLALIGFWDKAPGSVLAGLLIYKEERKSSFDRKGNTLDRIVFVQGGVHYPSGAYAENGEEIHPVGEKVYGVFAYQLDTASDLVWGAQPGSVVRAEMAQGLIDLGNGRQRYDYGSVQVKPPTPRTAAKVQAIQGSRAPAAPAPNGGRPAS